MVYTKMTIEALKLAYNAHLGQVDSSGLPYIFHPYHLAEQMNDEISCTVALLHDVVEDTDVTMDELQKKFPIEVTDALKLLTHEPDVEYFDYVAKVKENPIAKKVKLEDLKHNSDETRNIGMDIPEQKLQFWREKYAKAKEVLMD